tara:strand:- start:5430 stop:6422 length:993 start_codon:yes stop_codon:yes gene_type:complete
MMTDIKQIWVKQESASGKNVVRKRVESILGLNCFIGLIGVTGARMFQMELDTSLPVHKNFLRKFRGVEIQAIPFSQSHIEYTIILLEKELTEIFTLFIEDIIEKLGPVAEPQHALTIIYQRVNYWKKLFARVSGEFLTPQQQRGLFGELYFLSLLLDRNENKQSVLDSWQGVLGANQDFTFNYNAVEIKTTKANNPSLNISNELQLDYSSWNSLFLGVVLVNESAGSINSLSSIINEILDGLAFNIELVNAFKVKLGFAGIEEEAIDAYSEISFTPRNIRLFNVKNGFPVITPESLNSDSIHNVKYQIDIAACSSFEVQEEDVFPILFDK